ncbi:serine hydrolase domain-containing protein [Deinococcus roseus]|uniref:Serine hydrolase n=1 Tax=Deinococcus roseus TaxID=392414 RepID=A0ABQ2DG36_9DEIO|nr:serine hydrolase domain-containing protein [Deinococcus roseus]GGJ56331.1 serine hydrolase [Deinococcus roseus]
MAESFGSVQDLQAFVSKQASNPAIVGLSIAVVAKGKVQWSAGYGQANKEKNLPVTPDTPFMLGSISKVVTGTAIMQAVEQGKLSLDADIRSLLPFDVAVKHLITLRQLATHTSGIHDDYDVLDASYGPGDSKTTLQTFLKRYLAVPKHFLATGSTYGYSNVGLGLAGYVLERKTGMPLNVWSEKQIFGPLGMKNTHWFLKGFPQTQKIAVPYDAQGNPLPHYGYPTWPDGQLRSSANDLGRFLAAMMNGGVLNGKRILQSKTVQQMLKEQFPEVRKPRGQALFWELNKGLIGHNGGDEGVFTMMYFDPRTHIGVVLLMNRQTEVTLQVGKTIFVRLLREGGLEGLFR